MGQPSRQTISNSASANVPTNIVAIDYWTAPTNVTMAVDIISGSVAYWIQYTFDDIQADGWTPATGIWEYHPDTPSGTPRSTKDDFNFAYPVTACRAVLQTNASAGSIRFTVIQAGGGLT
jgi:hypothetical protein